MAESHPARAARHAPSRQAWWWAAVLPYIAVVALLHVLAIPAGLTAAQVRAMPESQLVYPSSTDVQDAIYGYSPGTWALVNASGYIPPSTYLEFTSHASPPVVGGWYEARLRALGWKYAGCAGHGLLLEIHSPASYSYFFTEGDDSLFVLSTVSPPGSAAYDYHADMTLQSEWLAPLPTGLVQSCP